MKMLIHLHIQSSVKMQISSIHETEFTNIEPSQRSNIDSTVFRFYYKSVL